MKKILVYSVLFSSLSVFAMGSNDKSAVREQLEELKSDGHVCTEIWPNGVIQSRIELNGELIMDLECLKEGSKITAKVVYKVLGTPGMRCRNMRAVEITDIKKESVD